MAGSFDCSAQHSLMTSACPAVSARPDLARIVGEPLQHLRLFVVNRVSPVGAELARPRLPVEAPWPPRLDSFLIFVAQLILSLEARLAGTVSSAGLAARSAGRR